jgi:DNA-binding NarL/FixJ family response regulator
MVGDGEDFMAESTPTQRQAPQDLGFSRAELSERELEIIELVAKGLTNLEISQQLMIMSVIFLLKLGLKTELL